MPLQDYFTLLRPYGLLVALGLLVAYLLGRWRLRRYGVRIEDFEAAFFWAVIGGVIGARVYHVVDYWSFYVSNPEKIIAIWEGGIGIFGAVFGGFFALFLWVKFRHRPIVPFLALAAPGLLLGQAIGRIGNYFNQEGFGPPTDLPWGVFIQPTHRPLQWIDSTTFHPTFFYEAIWLALGGLLLLFLEKRDIMYSLHEHSVFAGANIIGGRQIIGFYLIWFGVGRFAVEFLRFDTAELLGVKVAHVLSVVFVLIGSFLLINEKLKMQKAKLQFKIQN